MAYYSIKYELKSEVDHCVKKQWLKINFVNFLLVFILKLKIQSFTKIANGQIFFFKCLQSIVIALLTINQLSLLLTNFCFSAKIGAHSISFMASKSDRYEQKYQLAVNKDSKYVVNGFSYRGLSFRFFKSNKSLVFFCVI